MAGMEALGRLNDIVPIASGAAIKFRGASGILVVCTGADTFTITVASSFGGSYVAPTSSGGIITHYYQRADTNGTHAWTRQPLAAANAVTQSNAGYTTAFEVLTSMIADPYNYIKVTASATGLVTLIPHDLVVQRKPANLEILGA